MKQLVIAFVAAVLLPIGTYAEDARTLTVDPVELVKGNEVNGKKNISVTHGRYTYLFTNEQNKARFVRFPGSYEIQMGGARARMGPLSGEGTTDIYAVYGGHIYIFASEQCKKSFLAAPDDHLDRPDPVLSVTQEGYAKGRRMLDKIVEAMGGADRIDAVKSYQEQLVKEVEHNGSKTISTTTRTVVFPARFRQDKTWGDDTYTLMDIDGSAYFIYPDETWAMHEQQTHALQRRFKRNPLIIVRGRNTQDFVAVPGGSGSIDGKTVDLLTVSYDQTMSTLGIDLESHLIVSISYRGQGPHVRFGRIEKTFSDFKTINGITLPTTAHIQFNGEPAPTMTTTLNSVEIDTALDPALFKKPEL